MKSVRIKYVPVPRCKEVTCLCGEKYIEHKIEKEERCAEDGGVMEDTGYRVHVDTGDSIVIHPILQCSICKGLDLEHWSNQANILEVFDSGLKKFSYYRG